MKSTMPYWGVQTPIRRKLVKQIVREYPLENYEDWRATVEFLWDGAEKREERYCAIDLCDAPAFQEYQILKSFPLYTHLIVTGAWWDLVDPVATHQLRALLGRAPRKMEKEMLSWSTSDDLWRRRASVICQVGRKEETQLGLLYAVIQNTRESNEFFLRKAIGWALRDYAWTDPDEIRRYVEENWEHLSPLSRREATKNL